MKKPAKNKKGGTLPRKTWESNRLRNDSKVSFGGARPAMQQVIEVWCRRCGCQMVERRNRKTGQAFWGCSAYPACRHTMTNRQVSDDHDPDWDELQWWDLPF